MSTLKTEVLNQQKMWVIMIMSLIILVVLVLTNFSVVFWEFSHGITPPPHLAKSRISILK